VEETGGSGERAWAQSCQSQAALIHAAKPNPYRPHRRQAASLPPPLTSGQAGRRAGPAAIPLDRNAGDERRPAPLAGEPSSTLPI